MLRAILNKSWRQHPAKQQLYSHRPPSMKTIKVRWTRHVGPCWSSREELIRDVLPWTPSCDRTKAGQPAWTYLQQLCEDTGFSPEDLLEVMNDRVGWRERVRDIHADGTTMMMSLVGFRSLVEEESTYWALVNSLNLQNELMDVHQSDISKMLLFSTSNLVFYIYQISPLHVGLSRSLP